MLIRFNWKEKEIEFTRKQKNLWKNMNYYLDQINKSIDFNEKLMKNSKK